MHMIVQKHKFFVFVTIIFLFSCTRDMVTPVETNCVGEVTYAIEIEEIINTSCAYSGCHDGSGAAPGDYRTYQAMKPWLTPNKFENSVLVARDMPPNYADGPTSLTQDELDLVTCWVLNNYNEN